MKKISVKKLFSRKNAFLRNMLLTIIVLICIPLLIMQLIVIGQTSSEFQSNNEKTYLSALQTNANAYQVQLQMLSETALQLSLDTAVSAPLRNDGNLYTQLNAVKKLSTYQSSTPLVSDIAVYYRTEDYVLSSSCKRHLTDFCSYAIGNRGADTQRLCGFLQTLEHAAAFPTNSGNYLIYARPVSILSATKLDAVVCFLINAEDLAAIFEASIPYNASFGIADSSGELMLQGTGFPAALLEDPDFIRYLQSAEKVSYEASTDAGAMHIYKYTDESKTIFLACVAKDAADSALATYVKRIHFTVGFSLILMCVLVAATVYINYRPVKKLVTRHASNHTDSNLSEMELLDSVFFAKDERVTNQRNLLSDFLLGDFLFGTKVDQELLKQHFPASEYQHFAVAAISGVQLTSAQANRIAALLREALPLYEVHTTSMPNTSRSLFIFMSGEQPLDSGLLKQTLSLNVRRIAGEEAQVQIGDAVDDIQQLPHSYQTAVAGTLNIAQTENLPNENPQLTKDTRLFTQFVCTGDHKNALAVLEQIENTILSSAVQADHRSYHCYKLLFAYLSSVSENSGYLTGQETDQLLAFQTPVQLFALMRQSVVLYCNRAKATEQTSNAQLQSKLLQYVDSNLTSSELCLTSAADHMGLSIYAVSRLFKEYTQQNFKEYIINKRMEMAFELLRSTNQSISEIANAVGFDDASYFSEVFKKHYGVVPTKMRSNVGKEKKK